MCALGVALVGWTGTLSLIDLGALLEASTNAVDGALAWLGLSRKRAVTAAVSLLAQARSVVAIAVLGAIVQASADVASITRPSRVAVAFTLNALSVSAATVSVSWATACAVLATPAVLARAHTIEAVAVVGAVVGACLLRAVIALETLIALAGHLGSEWHTLTIA